jgi:nucleoside-diphosphate-sugar epimerase
MIYLIGGRGRLGRAIAALFPRDEVVSLPRDIYEDWWQSDSVARIGRFFETAAPGSTVLVTAGLLDPALPAADHQRVNLELAAHVMDGACKAGLRAVTFGTVMERLVRHPNAYVANKAALGEFAANRAASGNAVMHVQLHTLYGGGEPAPFMFLGQLCSALRAGRSFEMSPGRQLREYHHVDDDAVATRALVDASTNGVVALSHGAPCTLRELASHVFAELGRTGLLRIGARPEPTDDNYATVLPRPHQIEHVNFRPALPGVTTYLKSLFLEGQA